MATSLSVKQHKLRKLIASLSNVEATAEELISFYVPGGKSVDEIVAMLKIETESTDKRPEHARDRFHEAIKQVIQHVKFHSAIQENGLALFAGNFISEDHHSEFLNVEEIIPPEAISKFLFELDNHFQLQPLREMLRDQKMVGIIALDAKEAGFGVLNGERFELIESISSGVPGKSGKGGSSQRRYERERDMELTYFFHRIAEHATKTFLEKHKVNVLILGGPGQTKEDFLKGDYLHYELRNALLSTVDTQFSGKEGVKEALDKSSEELKNMCAPEEKRTVQRLLAELGKRDGGLAIYGMDTVLDALGKGEVEVALSTDSSDIIKIVAICKKCGLVKARVLRRKDQNVREMLSSPCEKCSGVEYEIEEKDIIDVLEDAAAQTGARVEVISSGSEEKAKLTALGGVAAILRYKSK